MSGIGENSWQEALKKELKTDQLERYLQRRLAEGIDWPLLGRPGPSWPAPPTQAPALSFTPAQSSQLSSLPELVKLGVWDVILDEVLLGSLPQALPQTDSRFWCMASADSALPQGARRVLHATPVVNHGGHAVLELAWLLDQAIRWAQAPTPERIGLALSFDREFFKSIAKARALKALVQAALAELKREDLWSQITWVGRVATRDFTLFDASSNILRNATAVSAQLIAGMEVVESLPFDLLIHAGASEAARAQRLALTTQLVLQQESGLGEVNDAAYGSYALEDLTRGLAEKAWAQMQELQGMDRALEHLQGLAAQSWRELEKRFNTRKLVLAGVNDYPNPREEVRPQTELLHRLGVRTAQRFEELRLRMQRLPKKPKVAVTVRGDYAALNARLSFTRNFFELLGLEVVEGERGDAQVWAVVASDEDHVKLDLSAPSEARSYLAGKTSLRGMVNIYAGMDVAQALDELLSWWERQ